jgi:hypothetical protein
VVLVAQQVTVIVQGVPGRAAWPRSRASIEASDIKQNYELMLHLRGFTIGEHFLATLLCALDAPTELILRLEDDAVVNQHILHNLWTWPDWKRPDFGAGWAFCPVAQRGRWMAREIHGSVGVLLKRSALPAIIKRCEAELREQPDRTDQDLMLSRAVRDSGLFVYLHNYPCLVEHPIDEPSSLDHRHTSIAGTSSGRFSSSWRRSVPAP